MASPFSPTPPVRSILQPKPSPPPTLPVLRDSCRGWSESSRHRSCSSTACSLRSAASYVSIRCGAAVKLCCERRVNPRPLLQKRAGVVKCATAEEIEAEKSMIEKDVKQRMEKTIETVRSKFNSVRTGRANPAMLDKVEVEYYGSPVSLKSIAQISTPEASSFLIQPYDKSSLKAIEKAIVSSDLGMTPNNDGEVIRLSLPQLTTERRKELSKVVAKQAEEGKAYKTTYLAQEVRRLNLAQALAPTMLQEVLIVEQILVALRNIRRDALKAYEKLEKEKKLSEDNVKDLSSDLQKLTDDYMKKIDTIYKQKEKELLTV